ncbi:amino acid adenylation domain-containing protein [Streptomyces sp. NPDC096040]|uniref:amino acid adenylation domain-containing protein n=1 Tax=Streptomyces sp. NPDC096040 TaxID=3155541 RepID=UPI0033284584
MRTDESLYARFAATVGRCPDAVALEVGGERYRYAELDQLAAQLAGTLVAAGGGRVPRRVGLLASRTVTAYAGYLAVQRLGAVVVPLNPTFPAARNATIAERAELDLVLAQGDQAGAALPVPVVAVDARRPDPGLTEAAVPAVRPVRPDDICYILFTSGSTGVPKGVPVRHRSVGAYLDHVIPRYGLGVGARLSQTFDLTFDLSVFDLFGAWASGGTVVVPGPHDLLAPARFVVRERITHWFSVPSVVSLAGRLRGLAPGSMPDLRWSLFCGEPLTFRQAAAWQAAAPASVVENLYGPTELTLSCTQYRLPPDGVDPAADSGATVPIGTVYPGLEHLVVDETGRPAPEGELCVRGVQRFPGYLAPEDNRGRFVRFADGVATVVEEAPEPAEDLWYRTGDRVRVSGGNLLHVGRLDQQVKVRGFRVELGEIETALRQGPGVADAVVVAVPGPGGETLLAAACTGDGVDPARLLAALRDRLPAYMVPDSVTPLTSFPLNANGKTDRGALRRSLAPHTDGTPGATAHRERTS